MQLHFQCWAEQSRFHGCHIGTSSPQSRAGSRGLMSSQGVAVLRFPHTRLTSTRVVPQPYAWHIQVGVNASAEDVLGHLVRQDTANAFNISEGDVAVTGISQVLRVQI